LAHVPLYDPQQVAGVTDISIRRCLAVRQTASLVYELLGGEVKISQLDTILELEKGE
jgi:hypothetical protein